MEALSSLVRRGPWRSRCLIGVAVAILATSGCATRGGGGPIRIAVIAADGEAEGEVGATAEVMRGLLVDELMLVSGVEPLASWPGEEAWRFSAELDPFVGAEWPEEVLAEATRLGLTHVLRLRVEGDAPEQRITAQLHRVAGGTRLWGAAATPGERAGLVDLAGSWVAAVVRAAGGVPRAPPTGASQARREAAEAERSGLDALRAGDAEAAGRALREAVQRDPGRVSAALGLAWLAFERGELRDALVWAEQARALRPDLELTRSVSVRVADQHARALRHRATSLRTAPPPGESAGPNVKELEDEAISWFDHVVRLEAARRPLVAARAAIAAGDVLAARGDLAAADRRWGEALSYTESDPSDPSDPSDSSDPSDPSDPHLAADLVSVAVGRLVDRWRRGPGGTALLAGREAAWAGAAPGASVDLVHARDCANATALHRAAERGDVALVATLIAAGAEVDARDLHASSPLHWAVWRGHAAVVEVLLGAGASASVREVDGRTPVHAAAARGDVAIIAQLLDAGGRVDARTRSLEAALHLAARADQGAAVAALAAAGATVVARDVQGRSPLHLAAGRAALAALAALVRLGAPLDGGDLDGRRPLHAAAFAGQPAAIAALARAGAAVDAPDGDGATPLHLAAGAGHHAAVTGLLAAQASHAARDRAGRSPLHYAAEAGALEAVEALLAAGASRSAVDEDELSPLDLAIESERLEVVRLLLGPRLEVTGNYGVEGDEGGEGGESSGSRALHRAIAQDATPAVIDALLQGGVGVDARDRSRRTPLMTAVAAQRLALVRHLLSRGANAAAVDREGETALHAAARVGSRELAALLLEASPALVGVADAHGVTALHRAGFAQAWAVVELLLERGADPGATTLAGAIAAHFAAHVGATALAIDLLARSGRADDLYLAAALGRGARVRVLVAAEPSAASAPGPTGLTALHLAVVNGQLEVVAVLLDAGVDVDVQVPEDAIERRVVGWRARDFAVAARDRIADGLLAARGATRTNQEGEGFGHGSGMAGPPPEVPGLAVMKGWPWAGVGSSEPEHADGVGARAAEVPVGAESLGVQVRERLLERDVLRRVDHVASEERYVRVDEGFDEVAVGCAGAHDLEAAARSLEQQQGLLALYGVPAGEAMGLVRHNLGRALTALGRYDEAEGHLEAALEALAGLPSARTAALEAAAELRALRGRWGDAERLLREALTALDDPSHGLPRAWSALGRSSLANLLTAAGRYAEAAAVFDELIALRAGGDRLAHAVAENNYAVLLDLLGDHAGAARRYEALLALLGDEPAGDVGIEATVLNNVAFARLRDGRLAEGAALARRAVAALDLPPWSTRPHYARGRALLTLARAEELAGDLAAAGAALERAEGALRDVYGDVHGFVADALRRRAGLLIGAADPEPALALLFEALALSRLGATPEIAWRVQDDLAAALARAGRPRAAIVLGKGAVETLQGLRAEVAQLPAALQRTYLAGRTAPYRRLAALLIDAGRVAEGQLVLDLLKDEEHFAFTRATRATHASASAPLFGAEVAVAEAAGGGVGARQVDLDDRAALRRWLNQFRRSVAAALAALDDDDELAVATIDARLQQLALDRLDDLRAFLEDPAVEGADAAFVQIFLGDDRVRILLTLAGRGTAPFESEVPVRRVFRMVSRLRELLQDPASDPRPVARELYDALIGPIRAELDAAGARTLMVWLDGALRYVPLGALHDGTGWLVERFAFARYTPVTHSALKDRRATRWRVAALGMSQAAPGFDALRGVPEELAAVVIDPKRRGRGVMDGVIHLDGDFTRRALTEALSDRAFQAVHIASHYAFDPGGDTGSFLLLGDRERLTLRALRAIGRRGRLDLLTFSACSTAVGLGALSGASSADDPLGLEVEGLANVVQQELAASVLATLWPVVDDGTVAFMRDLYAAIAADPALSKAEAVARTQRRMLRGEVTGGRPGAFSHPRFWAPFVLMGNWL